MSAEPPAARARSAWPGQFPLRMKKRCGCSKRPSTNCWPPSPRFTGRSSKAVLPAMMSRPSRPALAGRNGPLSGFCRSSASSCTGISVSEPTARATRAIAPDLELDGYVAAFESAWFASGAAQIDAFAPPPGHPRYLDVLGELVRVDLELAWERGDERLLEHYCDRFPDLFRDMDRVRSLAMEERRLRRAAGEAPESTEYQRRFGIELEG